MSLQKANLSCPKCFSQNTFHAFHCRALKFGLFQCPNCLVELVAKPSLYSKMINAWGPPIVIGVAVLNFGPFVPLAMNLLFLVLRAFIDHYVFEFQENKPGQITLAQLLIVTLFAGLLLGIFLRPDIKFPIFGFSLLYAIGITLHAGFFPRAEVVK